MVIFTPWKCMCEVRYPHAALLFDKRGEIAKRWRFTHEFTDWTIANNQVSVYDLSRKALINIGLQNSSIVMELPEGNTFHQRAGEFVNYIVALLNITKLNRIGYRRIFIAETKHFNLEVTEFIGKVYRFSKEDWAYFGYSLEDVVMALTLKAGKLSVNLTYGPMEMDQLSNYFESKDIKEKLPKVSQFLDLDFFQEDIEIQDGIIEEFIKESDNKLKIFPSNFVKLLDKML